MKKTLIIILAIFVMLPAVLCSCGDTEKVVEPMPTIGAKAIAKRECEEDPVVYSADDLVDYTGIGSDLYTDFYFCTAGDLISEETIALFKAADGKASDIESKLKSKLNSILNASNNYNEKNYNMAKEAVIKTVSGKYVYMVISPNVSDIVKIINECF